MYAIDRRMSKRLVRDTHLTFVHEPAFEGQADMADLSFGGMRLRLRRYLRPGANLMLYVNPVKPEGKPMEFKAQVAWCTPTHNDFEFDAGLRIYHDEPDAERDVMNLLRWPMPEEDRCPQSSR
jgi:hypothetical protein